jgi:hypothetical protein
MNRSNKLDCSITQLERLTNVKHSKFLIQFRSYEENEVMWIRTLVRLGLLFTKQKKFDNIVLRPWINIYFVRVFDS